MTSTRVTAYRDNNPVAQAFTDSAQEGRHFAAQFLRWSDLVVTRHGDGPDFVYVHERNRRPAPLPPESERIPDRLAHLDSATGVMTVVSAGATGHNLPDTEDEGGQP